jgi:hypothetical protein
MKGLIVFWDQWIDSVFFLVWIYSDSIFYLDWVAFEICRQTLKLILWFGLLFYSFTFLFSVRIVQLDLLYDSLVVPNFVLHVQCLTKHHTVKFIFKVLL